MYRILPYIFVALTLYGFLFYMGSYQADLSKQIIMKLDFLEMSELSKKENYRIDKIKRLQNIGYIEKQSLINKMVFIGATSEMMEYALGLPNYLLKSKENEQVIHYVYFLEGEKRPTFFDMNCISEKIDICKIDCDSEGKECILTQEQKQFFMLSNAYKKSAIDINNE